VELPSKPQSPLALGEDGALLAVIYGIMLWVQAVEFGRARALGRTEKHSVSSSSPI